jgi:hypothetical protein
VDLVSDDNLIVVGVAYSGERITTADAAWVRTGAGEAKAPRSSPATCGEGLWLLTVGSQNS